MKVQMKDGLSAASAIIGNNPKTFRDSLLMSKL